MFMRNLERYYSSRIFNESMYCKKRLRNRIIPKSTVYKMKKITLCYEIIEWAESI